MIRKLTLALLLTLPSIAVAVDLEGYYITAKGGVSKTMDTGTTSFTNSGGNQDIQPDNDLSLGTATAPSNPAVSYIGDNKINQFAYKLSAGTLVSITEQLSLDVNYQYVNLGAFKGGTSQYGSVFGGGEGPEPDLQRGINGGDIKAQELMVGLQYTFK